VSVQRTQVSRVIVITCATSYGAVETGVTDKLFDVAGIVRAAGVRSVAYTKDSTQRLCFCKMRIGFMRICSYLMFSRWVGIAACVGGV
jgi:hypothetical protein